MIQMSTGGRVLIATGLVASVLPLTLLGPSASSAAEPEKDAVDYGGFSGEAWSTPLRIEIFEPALPVPASPQVEFEVGYSHVEADSGTAKGRASYFWPGDVVGEGLRAFAGLLGLPVDNPITGGGYPVQVNSQYPGKPATQKDEPFPGMVMRTTSGDKKAVAETGFSPDGAVLGPAGDDGGDDGGAGGAGGAGLLGGLQGTLEGLLGGLGGGLNKSAAPTPSIPGLPPELAALVDMDGLVAVSEISAVDGPVTTATRSAFGEVRLLGGLVTVGGMEAVARASSDGVKGVSAGRVDWGKLTIAGQEFSIGPDGAVVAGKKSPIPGLDMLPADALKALGITFEIPKPVRTVDGDLATSISEGLRITIETKTLSPLLSLIPAGDLAELIPDEAGPVKGVVSGLSTLAPKVVITLGIAAATVDTVPVIETPPVTEEPETEPEGEPPASAPGVPGTSVIPPIVDGPPSSEVPSDTDDELVTTSAAPGLPDLYSFPGMLILAGVAAVGVAGTRLRKLGVLGAGAPCSHGFDTGLPDLRKV